VVVAATAAEEDASGSYARCRRSCGSIQCLSLACHFGTWPLAGFDDRLRAACSICVGQRELFGQKEILTTHSNAEAGIALICNCLPATVGQFRYLRDHTGCSSARHRTLELRGINPFSTGGSAATSSGAAATRNSLKMFFPSTQPQTALDEVELVANAQGNAMSEWESVEFSGIMRKVEVSHAVSFKGRESDGENNMAVDGI
jgi:hypothetical protein